MRTTVELPEGVYRRTEQMAQASGVSVDALISDVLERELGAKDYSPIPTQSRVKLPIIVSNQPGTMDLNDFDFDDLLA